MPPRNFLIIMVSVFVSMACYLKADRSRFAAQISEAMQVVSDLYVDEVNTRQLFENAMNGMVEGLDPYSGYIGPEEFKEMEQSLDQEFGGVGIEVEKLDDDKPILVLSPLYGSPGYRAGLRAGDTILAIDGEETVGMKRKDAILKMRGKPGSIVTLRFQHAGETKEIEAAIERAVIMVDSLLGDVRKPDGSWDFRLQENPRIGYLRLVNFGKHTAEELRKTLGDGQGCPFDGVILDLRNNAGGLLDSAVETCDLFVDRGQIVSTRGRDGNDRSSFPASRSMVISRDIPMVVLVNKFSASASEIVAACLQDHERAVIVGERTFGKGTVQNLFELEGGRSALKLTTASYWRPNGRNIHRRRDAPETEEWGVKPDPGFEVKMSTEELDRVLRARHDRDIFRETLVRPEVPAKAEPSGSAPSSSPSPEPSPLPPEGAGPAEDSSVPPASPAAGTAGTPPVIDTQLRRAIEFLEKQLSVKQS